MKSVDLTINFIQVVGKVVQNWICQSESKHAIFMETILFFFLFISSSVVSSDISINCFCVLC